MTAPDAAAGRTDSVSAPASLRRDLGALGLLLLVLAGIGLAFVVPWLPREPAGGAMQARYWPLRDGDATLVVELDPQGKPSVWISTNTIVINPIPANAEHLRANN